MALTQVKGSILSDELYRRENNLSDVVDKAIARNNLSVYAKTETYNRSELDARYLDETANLSDLENVTTARNNLSVYSKTEIDNRINQIPLSIWPGEIRRFSFDNPPPGFFALDGSTIVNGKTDFSALANCGSRFITISGNNLILADCVDFGRGKGSSGRSVGSFEGDAIRNITGRMSSFANWGVGRNGAMEVLNDGLGAHGGSTISHAHCDFNASWIVPTASENRPKSRTELVCIYHGVF